MLINVGIGTIAETIWFPWVSLFTIISCVEVLNLINMCVKCTDSLYLHIWWLDVKINSYAHIVIILERRFVRISCWVWYISLRLIWSIWYKEAFTIRSYMVSTCIHLSLSFLIWHMWCWELAHIIIGLVRRSHPVCVTVCAQVISSGNVRHRYWDIYENILFSCAHTR